ncbi:MAG: hypothetical protein HY216_13710 [Candidatus Rokubacteria bacterium]|nr:hypothetical protein [Candidatus Rokubacteria bacterium]
MIAVWLALVALAVAGTADAQPPTTVPAAVHVHSNITTGDLSLDELAAVAERQGIGALLLAENYLLRIEYGLPPFRALTRVVREERSVRGSLRTYFDRVADARRNHPRVVIVPGVELVPHYFWAGAPWTGRMTLYNVQKNIIVYGINDLDTLARLPVIANPPPRNYTTQSVFDALPVLLVIPGIALFFVKRVERRQLLHAVVLVRHRRWVSGLVLVAIAGIAFVRAWPFATDLYPPYADFGTAPFQTVIDAAERRGGATLWSFPEAPDAGRESVGPVTVTWETQPYADDLLRTFRYTSFGGLYEQRVRFVDPDDGWDRLLREAAAGERSRPAWAIGESGYHGASAGKRLGSILTVFLAEPSEAAILDAYRRGRMYALQRVQDRGLVLDEFTLTADNVTGRMGDTVRAPLGAPVEIRVAVSASDGTPQPVRVLLLKDGTLVEGWTATTPFRGTHRELAGDTPGVYRVDVRGPEPHRILANPIFVKRP